MFKCDILIFDLFDWQFLQVVVCMLVEMVCGGMLCIQIVWVVSQVLKDCDWLCDDVVVVMFDYLN